ncbi:hypothetical protein QQP08_019078 [Theobroma cacao]|nr:hypothetical protein QQP08_019078 [Theobroma cacao]
MPKHQQQPQRKHAKRGSRPEAVPKAEETLHLSLSLSISRASCLHPLLLSPLCLAARLTGG